MKKKTGIILGIAVVVVILVAGGLYLLDTSNGKWGIEIRKKGKEIFGMETCSTNHLLEGGGEAFTDWKCALCGKEETNPDTNVPVICANCSRITGRCMRCGKLEK